MKGICFKEPLFLKTVKGEKKETRRIMKPQPYVIRSIAKDLFDKKPHGIFTKEYDTAAPVYSFPVSEGKIINPRYNVGEVLYLKEPYYVWDEMDPEDGQISYKFDNPEKIVPFWENKLFMPEFAARYFIRITSVRAERLQDISEEDCLKEGIKIGRCGNEIHWMKAFYAPGDNQPYMTARSAYEELINRINGKDTWALNPYVWVYDFELTTSKI